LKIISIFLKKIDKIENFSVFNISSSNSLMIYNVAKQISAIFDLNLNKKIEVIRGKKVREKKYSINNKKMRSFLNIKTKNNYNKTLFEIIKFLKNETRIS
jgi:dTDP-D-glucose 4,6-dehydratase